MVRTGAFNTIGGITAVHARVTEALANEALGWFVGPVRFNFNGNVEEGGYVENMFIFKL